MAWGGGGTRVVKMLCSGRLRMTLYRISPLTQRIGTLDVGSKMDNQQTAKLPDDRLR